MCIKLDTRISCKVALFTGAWIEIAAKPKDVKILKVALFTGAWIEIIFFGGVLQAIECRALYGRVD